MRAARLAPVDGGGTMIEGHGDGTPGGGEPAGRNSSPEYIAELFAKQPQSWRGKSRDEVLAELNAPSGAPAAGPRKDRTVLYAVSGVVLLVVVLGFVASAMGSRDNKANATSSGTATTTAAVAKQAKAGTATCYDVSGAVTKFNSVLDGRRDSTMTTEDAAKGLQSTASKLDEGASFGGPSDFLALVTHASTTIKQMRVALLAGEDDVSVYQSSAVDDLTLAAPYCQ
jgi:hypothetical protein